MKIKGKIIEISDTQQVSDTFKKREFVIEYMENPQYPEYISFQLIQEKCMLLDNFEEEQIIEVSFNLKGRKWISPDNVIKYFNSLQAWRIEKVVENTSETTNDIPKSFTSNEHESSDDEDGLPF